MGGSAHSRVGDIGVGVCPCHVPPVGYVTMFVTGCSTVKTNTRITTIITTIGVATCGHPTVALTGSSSTVNMCNQPVHRIGDAGANCGPYVSVTGSGDTNSG
jgi:hypothetical protein